MSQDQGINLPFSSQGIEDPTYGLPVFGDGWKVLIIEGAQQMALRDNKGGRLLLKVKCVGDLSGSGDQNKNHIISLNLWHNDANVADKAKQELAAIMRAINNGVDMQMGNTRDLYNRPFQSMAQTSTQRPTPEYPNPQPQTNWRGYRPANAQGDGPANGQGGQPPQFGAPNQPQGGNPQGGQGGWNQPNQPTQQPQQQQGGWNGNGNTGNDSNGQTGGGWDQGGSNAPSGNGVQQPNSAPGNGGQGGWNGQNAQTGTFPSDPNQQGQNGGNNWGQPQQGQQPQQQPQQQGGWGPQGQQPQQGQPQQQGGWNQPQQGQPQQGGNNGGGAPWGN